MENIILENYLSEIYYRCITDKIKEQIKQGT